MPPRVTDDLRHLLMTADAVGGVWTYALDLARELAERGVRTTLAVLGPEPSPEQHAQARAAGAELSLVGGALDWTAENSAEVDYAGMQLGFLAARLRPDLVQLNSPAIGANVRFAAPVVAVAHSCVKTWWTAVRGSSPFPADLAWRAELTGRGYAAAEAVVAPSAAFALATQQAYDLPEPPRVVHNGRTSRPAAPDMELTPGRFVFTAGRLWDEGKDMATLDRAAERLASRVIAAGPLQGPNGARIALDHLEATGVLDGPTLERHLSLRPIFVSTSLYEPFGLAVLEAAQARCPLVLSDIPTFRELWDGAAVFFPPGDDAALARELRALDGDENRRLALGAAAQARAGRYAASAMAAGMIELYRDLLGARRSARVVA